jgi:hypothetical protein
MSDVVTVRCDEGPIPVQGRMMWTGDIRHGVPRSMVERILESRPSALVMVEDDGGPSTSSGIAESEVAPDVPEINPDPETMGPAQPKRKPRARRKKAEGSE